MQAQAIANNMFRRVNTTGNFGSIAIATLRIMEL